ncbi:MAG: hypothetical protein ACI9C3_000783, partial [Yoonia sp.]
MPRGAVMPNDTDNYESVVQSNRTEAVAEFGQTRRGFLARL